MEERLETQTLPTMRGHGVFQRDAAPKRLSKTRA